MNDKKDVLDFPLEEIEVPAAIKLIMGAASQTVTGTCDEQENVYLEVDNERLLQLSEKLEARVEDAIEAASAVRNEAVPEDAPNDPDIQEVEGHDVSFIAEDFEGSPIIKKVVVDGAIYVLACNTPVYNDVVDETNTFCIKQFQHQSPVHEDLYGNESA